MKNTRKFAKDPQLQWEKVYCPICGEPTGEKSKCYEIEPSNVAQINPMMALMPTYSIDCTYRRTNIWSGNVNYVISNDLLVRWQTIEGVEAFNVMTPYNFQIHIAKLFDEEKVKQEIVRVFNTFIKEMQAIELDILPKEKEQEVFKINFPNGASFVPKTSEEKRLCKEILDDFPNVSEG